MPDESQNQAFRDIAVSGPTAGANANANAGELATTWVRRLARARVPLGFASGIAVLWLAQPTPTLLEIGLSIALLGESLRIWAAGHLEKSREVTQSGPYRLFRHPLYVGSSIMGIGLAVAAGSIIVTVVVLTYLIATLGAAIRTEEAFLRTRFGGDYDAYKQGRAATAPAAHRRFSLARAMRNREYRAIIGLAIAALLLCAKWWLGM
jgi:protein-S-isoprenylcysteine O-methyltransferase Ste14